MPTGGLDVLLIVTAAAALVAVLALAVSALAAVLQRKAKPSRSAAQPLDLDTIVARIDQRVQALEFGQGALRADWAKTLEIFEDLEQTVERKRKRAAASASRAPEPAAEQIIEATREDQIAAARRRRRG